MTPAGHGAVAFCLAAASPRLSWPAVVLGSVIVDIDFVLVGLPQFNALHRVITHNVFFVALVAAIGAAWAPASRRSIVALSLALGGASHLLVDSMLDGNPSNGIGVAFLWPLSQRCFSPANLVPIEADPPTWHDLPRMAGAVLRGVVYELPFYVLCVWLGMRRGWRDPSREAS